MTEENTDIGSVARRTFLRSSAVAGTGAIGIGTASAKSDSESINQIRLIEAGVEYDVPSYEDPEYAVHSVSIDDRQEYAHDADTQQIHLLPSSSQRTIDAFENANVVVRTPSNELIPTGRGELLHLNTGETRILSTKLSRDLRPITGIELDGSVTGPSVSLETGRTVSVADRTAVAPEKQTAVDLDEDSAPIRTAAKRDPSETRTVSLSVTPQVRVRNHGVVDVIDSR